MGSETEWTSWRRGFPVCSGKVPVIRQPPALEEAERWASLVSGRIMSGRMKSKYKGLNLLSRADGTGGILQTLPCFQESRCWGMCWAESEEEARLAEPPHTPHRAGAWGNCPGSLGGRAPDASGGPLGLRGAWEEPESWTELSGNLPAPTEDSTGLGVTRLSLHLDHQGSGGSVEGCQDGQRTWVGPGGLFCTKQATGPKMKSLMPWPMSRNRDLISFYSPRNAVWYCSVRSHLISTSEVVCLTTPAIPYWKVPWR